MLSSLYAVSLRIACHFLVTVWNAILGDLCEKWEHFPRTPRQLFPILNQALLDVQLWLSWMLTLSCKHCYWSNFSQGGYQRAGHSFSVQYVREKRKSEWNKQFYLWCIQHGYLKWMTWLHSSIIEIGKDIVPSSDTTSIPLKKNLYFLSYKCSKQCWKRSPKVVAHEIRQSPPRCWIKILDEMLWFAEGPDVVLGCGKWLVVIQ